MRLGCTIIQPELAGCRSCFSALKVCPRIEGRNVIRLLQQPRQCSGHLPIIQGTRISHPANLPRKVRGVSYWVRYTVVVVGGAT
jgi:hypothetical protein